MPAPPAAATAAAVAAAAQAPFAALTAMPAAPTVAAAAPTAAATEAAADGEAHADGGMCNAVHLGSEHRGEEPDEEVSWLQCGECSQWRLVSEECLHAFQVLSRVDRHAGKAPEAGEDVHDAG